MILKMSIEFNIDHKIRECVNNIIKELHRLLFITDADIESMSLKMMLRTAIKKCIFDGMK